MLHPKAAVQPGCLDAASPVFGVAKLDYAAGHDPSGAAPAGFLLHFAPTQYNDRLLEFDGFDPQTNRQGLYYYKVGFAAQPIELWFRPDATQPPKLLGKTWVVGQAKSKREERNPLASRTRVEIVNVDKATLAGAAVASGLGDIPFLVAQMIAADLVVARGRVAKEMNTVMTDALASTEKRDGGGLTAQERRDSNGQHANRPAAAKVVEFRADRARRDKSGDVVLEIDMRNRLPCRVQGDLEADGPLDYFTGYATRGGSRVPFDLEPGAAATLEFRIPAETKPDLTAYKNDTVIRVGSITRLAQPGEALPTRALPKPAPAVAPRLDPAARERIEKAVAPMREALVAAQKPLFTEVPAKGELTPPQRKLVMAKLRQALGIARVEGMRLANEVIRKEIAAQIESVGAALDTAAPSLSVLRDAHARLSSVLSRITFALQSTGR